MLDGVLHTSPGSTFLYLQLWLCGEDQGSACKLQVVHSDVLSILSLSLPMHILIAYHFT